MASEAAAPRQRTFLGHPVGLYILFFTEMWERFSFYGMKALLMVYMLNYFRWSQQHAGLVFKMYSSLVYVTPIIGGFLADRYLGNRRAVIIGAVLMGIGHFLMAFDEFEIFMSALVFLIAGNGMFKPNMSIQVGRLYPANDGRRDGAYTIFYMGINLGAFLAPVLCGWLAENTVGGYHSGFTMAGIGMFLGLIIYVVGQPFVKEVAEQPPEPTKDHETVAGALAEERDVVPGRTGVDNAAQATRSEQQVERTPSKLGKAADLVPTILYVLGGVLLIFSLYKGGGVLAQGTSVKNLSDLSNAFALAVGGGCFMLIGFITSQVLGGVRDRILSMLILGIFLIFFWGAFEQAGSALNVWADQFTNRFLTEEPKAPPRYPEVEADKEQGEIPEKVGKWDRFINLFPNMLKLKQRGNQQPNQGAGQAVANVFNPVPTAWYLSINAVLIVLLAPLFAWLWTALDRRGIQPSIPMKMVLGIAFMSAAMALMMAAARSENQTSEIGWTDPLPSGILLTEEKQLAHTEEEKKQAFNAGRLTFDEAGKKLQLSGVLDRNVADSIVEATAPEAFQKKVKELQEKSKEIDGDKVKSVEVVLDSIPPGFDADKGEQKNEIGWKFTGLKASVVKFDRGQKKLIAFQPLAEKEVRGLKMAAGDPKFRDTLLELYQQATGFRVSMWWLFWSYLLATLGELCLSPVGLSMVSKMAPARFATMLMGVWMIISFFGNFVAGSMGEIWGTIPPTQFYLLSAVVVGVAALVLLVLARAVTALMHGVK